MNTQRNGNPSRLWLLVILALLIFGGGAFGFWWLNRSGETGQETPGHQPRLVRADELGYVGSQACVDCHQEIAASFARHPMGQSLRVVHEARQIEDYDSQNTIRRGHAEYRALLNAKAATHNELIKSKDGTTLADQQVDIGFTVGSGARGRSYLFNLDGRLYQSPLTWYVEKAIWDLAPGYRPNQHQRFERRVTNECLSCHAGQLNYFAGEVDRNDPQQPFAEMSIGCERCHGPGKSHVAFQQEGQGTDTIVNPVKLPKAERDSVCHQCHLGGNFRIPRAGKSFYDFRPGQRLGDSWSVFVAGTGFDRQGKALFTSHVEQMRASQCYQQTKGEMTCYSCHDPHRSPTPDEKLAFYRQKCLSCHEDHDCSLPRDKQAAAPANDSCYYCHMPRAESSDVNHTSLADHRVFKSPGDFAAANQQADKSTPWRLFPDMAEGLEPWERNRAVGAARFKQAIKSGDRQLLNEAKSLLSEALREQPEDPLTNSLLGQVYHTLGDYEAGKRYFSATVARNPHDATAWSLLGLSCFHLGDDENGIKATRRSLELEPWSGVEHGLLGEMLARQGSIDEAIVALRKGLSINPLLIRLHSKLAELLEKKRLSAEADQHRQTVIRLQELRSTEE